jgi:hypothetical protein
MEGKTQLIMSKTIDEIRTTETKTIACPCGLKIAPPIKNKSKLIPEII